MIPKDDGTCSRDTGAILAWLPEFLEQTRQLRNVEAILTVAACQEKPHAVRHACADCRRVVDSLERLVERMPEEAD